MAGIWLNSTGNSFNNVIKNCNINNHYRGIYCQGGYDITIENNSLLNSGHTNDQAAITLENIQQALTPGGITMSGNTFGGTTAFSGLKINNMRDLIIGDASVAGRNIELLDNCGLNNLSGTGNSSSFYALGLVNVKNAVVDNIDISRPITATPVQDFTGLRVDNGASYGPVTIKNCDIKRHRSGIVVSGGKDYTITGNDLMGCGLSSEDPALYITNITQHDGSIPMGIIAHSNIFGTINSLIPSTVLRLENIEGLKISDGSVSNTQIVLEPANGVALATGNSGSFPAAVLLYNVSGVTVEKLNLDFVGTQSGTGIRIFNNYESSFGNIIKDNSIKNRRMGLYTINGSDYTISGNNFQSTGIADDEPAIRMEHAAEGMLSGGVSISGNIFGGTGASFGMKFVNMSNLKISDGTVIGTNVNIGSYGTNGFNELTTGYALHLSGVCNSTVSTLNLSRSGIVKQGTGLR